MSAPRNSEDWVILDVEVSRLVDGRAAWCVGFLFYRDGRIQHSVIDSTTRTDALEALRRTVKKIKDTGVEVITYNGTTYDLFWIHRMITCPVQKGYYDDARSLNDWIIGQRDLPYDEQLKPWELVNEWSHPETGSFVAEKHIDLITRTVPVIKEKGESGTHGRGLKLLCSILGFESVVTAPYGHNTPLTPEQWAETVSYNQNDLDLTYQVWGHFSGTVTALGLMSAEIGEDLRSCSDAQVAERVLKAKFAQITGSKAGKSPVPMSITLDLVDIPRLESPEAADWQRYVETTVFPITPTGSVDTKSPEGSAAVRSIRLGHHVVDVAFGGLHGKVDKPGVYKTDDRYQVMSLDVASYYPAILIEKGLPVGSMGSTGTDILRELRDRRVIEKARSKDKSLSKAERDKADKLQNALKISINSVFGKTGSIHSALYSPRTMPSVCVSGQLHLIALIERLVALNRNDDDDVVRILDSNTDGLYVRIRRDDDRWKLVRERWQAESGFVLEVKEHDALILKSQNNRATVDNGEMSGKGSVLRGADDYSDRHASMTPAVVVHAVIEALMHGTPPETTIRNCTDVNQFLYVKQFRSEINVHDQEGNTRPFGKLIRCYAAYDDKGLKVSTTSKTKATGLPPTIGLAMKLPDRLPPDLHWSWYVGEARELLATFQPVYDPSQLTGEARALWDRGLVPSPARRKADARGVSVKNPAMSLESWERYPTLKCHTGKRPGGVNLTPGVIVVDIDEPAKWSGVIGLDIDKMLTLQPMTVHSGTDPDNVRRGLDKGKLIFRFDDPDDWFNKLPTKATVGLQKAGIEIFYGQKMAAVLGAGEGKTYHLSGELQELPEWLELILRKLTGRKAPKPPEPPKPRSPRKKPDGEAGVNVTPWAGELYKPDGEYIGDDDDPPDFDMFLEELATTVDERFRSVIGNYTTARKNSGDDRRWMARCECPGGLESHNYTRRDFKMSNRDGLIQLDETTGRPIYSCVHGSCTFAGVVRQKTVDRDWAIRNHKEPEPPDPEPPQTDGTAISRKILNLSDGVLILKAPTGSGKTYSAALAAGLAHRQGRDVVYAAPTLLALSGFMTEFQKIHPDLVKHVVRPTAKELQESDSVDDDEPEMVATFEEDDIELKPAETRRIFLVCHERLNRRGFSRFMRIMWRHIEEMVDPLIMIDESHMFIRGSEVKRKLSGMVKPETNANGRVEWLDRSECPASVVLRKGGRRYCDTCKHVPIGSVYDINLKMKTPEIRPWNRYSQGFVDVEPTLSGGHHVEIRLEDFELGEKLYPDPLDSTGWIRYVRAYKGRAITRANRRSLNRSAYRGNNQTREGSEYFENYKTAGLVLEHEIAHLFAAAIRFSEPVHKTGELEGQPISMEDILKIHVDGRRDAVVFPVRACGTPYLSGYDLVSMERIRDLVSQNKNASVVFMSASHESLDIAVYTEVFGECQIDTVAGQPDRIEGLTVVTIGPPDDSGQCDSFAALTEINVKWLKPLDVFGQWLVFATTNSQRNTLDTAFKTDDPSYPFVTASGSGSNLNEGRSVTADGSTGDPGTLASTRSPIGCGFNGVNVATVVADYRATRLALDLIVPEPSDDDQELFNKAQSEERDAAIIQNFGRPLRGHPEKRAVIFLVNATIQAAADLIQKANIQGRITDPIQFRHYNEMSRSPFEDAAKWLSGEEWTPTSKHIETLNDIRGKDRATKRKNKRETAIASMLESAQAWKEGGGDLYAFVRKQNLHVKTKGSMPGILTMVQRMFQFQEDDNGTE